MLKTFTFINLAIVFLIAANSPIGWPFIVKDSVPIKVVFVDLAFPPDTKVIPSVFAPFIALLIAFSCMICSVSVKSTSCALGSSSSGRAFNTFAVALSFTAGPVPGKLDATDPRGFTGTVSEGGIGPSPGPEGGFLSIIAIKSVSNLSTISIIESKFSSITFSRKEECSPKP